MSKKLKINDRNFTVHLISNTTKQQQQKHKERKQLLLEYKENLKKRKKENEKGRNLYVDRIAKGGQGGSIPDLGHRKPISCRFP